MALFMILRRMKVSVTAHGVRAAFRSWCADTASPSRSPRPALCSSSVVEAYQRSSMVERRRLIMQAWSDLMSGKITVETAEIVPLRAAE